MNRLFDTIIIATEKFLNALDRLTIPVIIFTALYLIGHVIASVIR